MAECPTRVLVGSMPQRAVDIAHLKANFARRFSCNRGHAAFPRAISESGDNGVLPFLSLYAVFRAWNGPSDDVGDVGDLIIWFPLHGRPDSRGEAQWTPPSRRRTDGGGDIFLPMHLCDSETGAVDVFRH